MKTAISRQGVLDDIEAILLAARMWVIADWESTLTRDGTIMLFYTEKMSREATYFSSKLQTLLNTDIDDKEGQERAKKALRDFMQTRKIPNGATT